MKRYHYGNHWFLPTFAAQRSELLPMGTHWSPGCHSLLSSRSWPLAQLWASLQLTWAISATQLPNKGHFLSLESFSPFWPGELWPLWEKNTFCVRLFLAHTGNHPCLYATFSSSVFDSCFGIIICLQYSFPHKKMNFVQSQISFLSLDFIWLAQGPVHAKIIHMNKWLSLWVPTWMKSCLNEFGVCFTSGQWYKVITKWTPLSFSFSQEDNFFSELFLFQIENASEVNVKNVPCMENIITT